MSSPIRGATTEKEPCRTRTAMPEDLPLTKIVAACLHDLEKKGDAALHEYCEEYPSLAKQLQQAIGLVKDLNELATVDSSSDALFAGRYELRKLLGVGGMGRVYRALDTKIDREVALKQVRPEIASVEEIRRRFEREVRAATRIEHPNLCLVYDGDIWEGVPYMVMELIEGETLHDRIYAGDHTPAELTLYVEKIAAALHAVHEQNMLHRDVKPANIMIRADDEPALLDFGLARDLRASDAMTKEGSEPGTWSYMSPEQLAPKGREPDRRTDVYSLGLVLYECLTARRAFDGGSELELKTRILKEMPISVRKATHRIANDLAVVVEKAIAKNRDDRYATAGAFAEDLRRIREHEPIAAQRSGPVLRTWRWSQRNPMLTALLVVLTIGVTTSTWLYSSANAAYLRANAALIASASRRAELHSQRGNWGEALAAYDDLENLLGENDVGVALGRIAAWDASDRMAESIAELARLVERKDLGAHRAKVLLLSAEMNVNRLLNPGDKLDQLEEARASGQLSGADVHYIDAILADSVGDSIEHLRSAIATDPWNRRALEMLGNLALFSGRLELATEVLHMREVLYVDDPNKFAFEAFYYQLLGEDDRAEQILQRAKPAVREVLSSWMSFLKQASEFARAFDQIQVDSLVDPDFGFWTIVLTKYVPIATSAMGMIAKHRKTEDGIAFRVPPAVGRAVQTMLRGMVKLTIARDAPGYAEMLEEIGAVVGDGMFVFGAATTYLYSGDFARAEERFREALTRHSAVLSKPTIRLYLLEAQWQIHNAEGKSSGPTPAGRKAVDTILEVLQDPMRNTKVARHLFKLAKNLGANHMATEIALRWRRAFPKDDQALAAVEQAKAWIRTTKPLPKKPKNPKKPE